VRTGLWNKTRLERSLKSFMQHIEHGVSGKTDCRIPHQSISGEQRLESGCIWGSWWLEG
jgi:hypothetical protein